MLELHYGLFIAQLINLGILYLIFQKFIGKKLTRKIYERQEQLLRLKLAEEHYREKMELAEKEKQAILETAKKSSEELLEESRHIAELKTEAIIKEAHEKALGVLNSGKQEIEKERISMLSQVKSHIIDISLKLNKKILQNPELEKEFLEREVEKL